VKDATKTLWKLLQQMITGDYYVKYKILIQVLKYNIKCIYYIKMIKYIDIKKSSNINKKFVAIFYGQDKKRSKLHILVVLE